MTQQGPAASASAEQDGSIAQSPAAAAEAAGRVSAKRSRRIMAGLLRIAVGLVVCLAPAACLWLWSRVILGHALPLLVYIYLVMAGAFVGGPAIDWIIAGFLGEDERKGEPPLG